MAQTIDEADYDIEVRNQARELRNALEEEDDTPVNMVVDILDAHPWFEGGELTGADYGAIIGDFDHYRGGVSQYRDPETLVDSHDFETTLRRMAFATFEADVLRAHEEEDFET